MRARNGALRRIATSPSRRVLPNANIKSRTAHSAGLQRALPASIRAVLWLRCGSRPDKFSQLATSSAWAADTLKSIFDTAPVLSTVAAIRALALRDWALNCSGALPSIICGKVPACNLACRGCPSSVAVVSACSGAPRGMPIVSHSRRKLTGRLAELLAAFDVNVLVFEAKLLLP